LTQLAITAIRGDAIVLSGAKDLAEQLTMGADGRTFHLKKDGDTAEVDAAILSYLPSPDFMIVGYGLTMDGWLDPVAFLRAQVADVNPAAFAASIRRANGGVRR